MKKNFNGYTLLHSAARTGNSCSAFLEAILDYSPKVTAFLIQAKESEFNKTPLSLAKDFSSSELIRIIEEKMGQFKGDEESFTAQTLDETENSFGETL